MVDTSKRFLGPSRKRSSLLLVSVMKVCMFPFFHTMMMRNVMASNSFLDFSRTITSTIPSIPNILTRTASIRSSSQQPHGATTTKRRKNNTGFYYGIREDTFFKPFYKDEQEDEENQDVSSSSKQGKKKNPWNNLLAIRNNNNNHGFKNAMGETLNEMREMREEISALRHEMALMKKQLYESSSSGRIIHEDEEDMMDDHNHPHGLTGFVARRKRQKEFDQIGMDVEQWATELVKQNGNEEYGWKEVQCNRMFKNKFNKRGNIRCFLKWMPDSRGKHAAKDDDGREYPCVQVIASIDAPIQDVCDYLSEEARLPEYNDLVIEHHDIEDISPHSKICWGSSPQILFIKPRDFVTFCHHHWKRDGTQVVINQAVEHEDAPAVLTEGQSKYCRAYALRGANFIAKDPDDPNKTVFTILSHADPGGGLPPWAMKTAVNAVAPIEPFKLFHKIEQRVIASKIDRENRAQNVSSIAGRSSNPGGLSQIGYACFWPNGGGLKEGYLHNALHNHNQPHDTHQQQPPSESNPSYHNNHPPQLSTANNNHAESNNNAQLMVQEPSENSAEPVAQINH